MSEQSTPERALTAEQLGSANLDWHQAALIAGEHAAANGPKGYYDKSPHDWLTWMRETLAILTAERDEARQAKETLAGYVTSLRSYLYVHGMSVPLEVQAALSEARPRDEQETT